MERYTPIFVNTSGKKCCVVGGGRVAERKIKGLMHAEAQITVISPELTPVLQQLHHESRIQWIDRSYRNGDLRGPFSYMQRLTIQRSIQLWFGMLRLRAYW